MSVKSATLHDGSRRSSKYDLYRYFDREILLFQYLSRVEMNVR